MTSPIWRRAAGALTLCAALFNAAPAEAQSYVFGAAAQVASGVDGGGGARGHLLRARTRLRFGVDAHVDEFPQDIFAAGLLIELEPRSSFGLDVRYMHALGKRFVVDVGAIGYVVPATILGPSVSLEARLPLSQTSSVT